jgi:hypothetical protein
MIDKATKYILMLDTNAPWMVSLMKALPNLHEGILVMRGWRIYSLGYLLFNLSQFKRVRTKHARASKLHEKVIFVPGWTRFARISTNLISRKIKQVIRRFGAPEAIIYTTPLYTGVAERFTQFFQVYYAYDPYRYYGWGRKIDALEKNILNLCHAAFGVSRQLVEDFRQVTTKPVYHSPNAASSEFIKLLRTGFFLPPEDLKDISGKIVGCIGQLNWAPYDWALVDCLSQRMPDVTFVFVGEIINTMSRERVKLERILKKPNVRWVGFKPHSEVPSYLSRFDVCFNPLAVNDHNNRRSLLRLYDYLATDKPILSTAISDAFEHKDFIEIGRDCEECIALLRRIFAPTYRLNLEDRHNYISQNTWENRAANFQAKLLKLRQTNKIGKSI